MEDEDWRVRARCHTEDAEILFRPGAYQRTAKLFCLPCPVRAECLGWALDHRIEEGVWGGMTERERRRARLEHPDVVDWSKMIVKARDDWEAERAQRSQRVTKGDDARGSAAG